MLTSMNLEICMLYAESLQCQNLELSPAFSFKTLVTLLKRRLLPPGDEAISPVKYCTVVKIKTMRKNVVHM